MGYVIIFGILIVGFVLAIIYFAGRSGRKGERYIGTDDPIQRYEDQAESTWSYPWGNLFGRGASGEGWQWRVRAQARRDAAEKEKDLRAARRKQREHHS